MWIRKTEASESDDPKLRVLDQQDRPADATVGGGQPKVRVCQPVEVLKPDNEARLDAKTYKPDVVDILDQKEVVNSEEQWGGATLRVPPIGWFVLVGLVLLSLSVWVVMVLWKAQPELETIVREKQDLGRERSKELVAVKNTLAAMERAVQGYLAATTVDEMLTHVRHAARVRPLMEKYYQTRKITPVEFERFDRTLSLGLESMSFMTAEVILRDGGKRALVIEQIGPEEFVVDWESEVCYQPIEWKTYLEEKVTTPMDMRVYIIPDNFYAYEFRNEKKFDCYRLVAKGHDDHLFGFVRKGSEVASKLNRYTQINGLMDQGAVAQPLMLKIRFPADSVSKKCVWIDEMIAPRWVRIELPEKESSQ